jgi:hypothetical protein
VGNIKMYLRDRMRWYGLDWSGSGYGTLEGSYEHSNESSGSITFWKCNCTPGGFSRRVQLHGKIKIMLSLPLITWATRLKTYGGFPAGGREAFLLSTASILVLGPTQPPFHWVTELLSLSLKRPGAKLNAYL